MRVIALIAAAGQGTRLGAAVPKAFVRLRERTLVERSVAAMLTSGVVDEVVVLVSPAMESFAREVLERAGLLGENVRLAHGGGERADSVWAGLRTIADEEAVVLIHDAARALTPPGMIARVARRVLEGAPAVIPVLPVADTIKSVAGDTVTGTPDRATLRAVQTPQGFRLSVLRAANEAYFSAADAAHPADADPGFTDPGFTATDDASLVEWHGVPVVTVQGDPMAFKVTTPIDMTLARTITDEAEPTIFEVPS
ncbi:2-C-methyl-D-erythritol 4-phosphate cytidylyltransferase [Corynebacterium nasicanis]